MKGILAILLLETLIMSSNREVSADSDNIGAASLRQNKRSIHLVIDDELLKSLDKDIPAGFNIVSKSRYDANELLSVLSAGDSLVWIGNGDGLPKDLAVGCFRPSPSPLDVTLADDSPLFVDQLGYRKCRLSSGFISPPKEMPHHNIDEEVRAELLPILEARDRFGRVVGYPGILMSYYAPSLVGRRFDGSECFFFFFDHPAEALDTLDWLKLLEGISLRFQGGIHINRVETDYASYQTRERVRIRARVRNSRSKSAAVQVRFQVKEPGGQEFGPLAVMRRVPDGCSETEALCDFKAPAKPGLWTVRVEVCVDPEHAEALAIKGYPVPVDRRDLGFILLNGPVQSPSMVTLNGPSVEIDGENNFWAGTHYYPSSSWWEWVWRDFRPLKASLDFASMRYAGYRIVRIWVDPVLDETTLRAMDAAIHLASEQGLVLDVCIFTQWIREVGFERPSGERVTFDFRDPRDFNVYSFSLRHLDLQREYVKVLAERWKDAGNVIYNLSNEVYVKAPDATQMDSEVLQWKGIPPTEGTVRDTLLFRGWAAEMTQAIRESGSRQPVIPGYMFSTLDGGDNYLGNQEGDIVPWHSYYKPENTGAMLQYFDPCCSGRPVILEEFGRLGWNDPTHYEASVHFALAGGAAAALSYEWGVSWLSREACFYPLPLRECLVENTDPRWFKPAIEQVKTWSEQGVGICATPSGFGFGSIYHGTPFPAAAAVALGRLGLVGKQLGRISQPEAVYVVIPTAQLEVLETVQSFLQQLWIEGILFGVWQESRLEALPSSAHVLLCPWGVSAESAKYLEELRQRGVEVYRGEDDLRDHLTELPKVNVTPGETLSLLVRRTVSGTLYCLIGKEKVESVRFQTKTNEVLLEVSEYALVQEQEAGIRLLEASGKVLVNGRSFCTIDDGRAFLVSDDGLHLPESKRIKVLVTKPTRIEFQKDIRLLSVVEEGTSDPVAVLDISGRQSKILEIDNELSRYVLVVTFTGN